jgi:colanic acid/amylovoran biosynthesis glycosyltransferase
LKILHFVDSFAKPSESFIKRYIQKCLGFSEVAIVAFDFIDVPDDIKEKVRLYKIDNPTFSRKNISGIKRYIRELFSGKEIWYDSFHQVLSEFKPNIIHCHFGTMGVKIMHFQDKFPFKIPFVTTIYAYDITYLPLADPNYRKNLGRLWNVGAAFFSEGPALAKKLYAYGCPVNKCLINPLIIPVNEYPQKKTYRTINDPIKFLFIGRFVEKKGFHVFLEALGRLTGKLEPFTLDIIGFGPMQPVYEELIARYKLSDFVKWHGMVQHRDIIPIIKNYDILAHSSLTASNGDDEGGSATIIIEAQAVGLPIITTNHADIPYVMGYHDFIAEENDVELLMSTILKIVNCENIEYYTAMGREKVLANHDLENNNIYETNLRKILAG